MDDQYLHVSEPHDEPPRWTGAQLRKRVHWTGYVEDHGPTDNARRNGWPVLVYGGDSNHREIELPITGYPIPEPWSSLFVRYREDGRTVCGGAEGKRFLSNGHWLVYVDESAFQAAATAGWHNAGPVVVEPTDLPLPMISIRRGARRVFGAIRDVEAMLIRRLGCGSEGLAVGPVVLRASYVELLRERGVEDVAAVYKNDPFVRLVVAPGVAAVQGNRMPEDYWS